MPMRWRTLAGSGRPRDASARFATSRRAVVISSWSPSVPTAARTSSTATPRWRSSAESARRARPRPWCLVSTHARANAASSISRTSASRPRTASATSSGTRRRRSALASCALVRGAAASSRRQISRAASCGSGPPPPASAASLPSTAGGAGQARARRGARGTWGRRVADHAQVPGPRPATGGRVGVQAGPYAELLLDLLLDLVGHIGVVVQEGAGVLLALSQLVALVGVPGAGLAHDTLLDPEVDQAAFPADPCPEQDVELCAPEWRRQLVLDHLYPGAAADGLGAVLERLDPAHVEPDRGVELQRPPAAGRFRRAEHHADLLPQLVDEDRGGLRLADRAGELAQGLGHEPGLEADMAVPHLALDLGPGHQRGDRVDDDHVHRGGADQHVGDLQRLLAGVGLGDEQPIGVHAQLPGVVRVERVLGVDEGGDPAGLLRACGRVQGHRCLPASFRAVYLDDPAAGEAADAERDVQRDRPGRDHLDRRPGLVTEPHDRAPAELPLDLGERRLQGLLPVAGLPARPVAACHGYSCRDHGLLVGPRRYAPPPTKPRALGQLLGPRHDLPRRRHHVAAYSRRTTVRS